MAEPEKFKGSDKCKAVLEKIRTTKGKEKEQWTNWLVGFLDGILS